MPDEDWTITEIKNYLDDKGIDYAKTDKKADLLAKAGV